MIFLFLCNQQNPKCCHSYFCGVECMQTTHYEFSAVNNTYPVSFEDLENRFIYVGEFVVDGVKQMVFEEKERVEDFS